MTTDPKLACFYHPIKVIFLDDNRAFLDALDLEFSSKFNILTLTNSDQAFHLLNRGFGQQFTILAGLALTS